MRIHSVKLVLALASCFTFLATCFGSAKPNSAAVKTALTRRYSQMERDFRAQNFSDYSSLLTNSFTINAMGKTMTKAQTLADLKKQSKLVKNPRWVRNITHLVINNKTAVASVTSDFSTSIQMHPGAMSTFTLHETKADTWVQTPRGWLLQNTAVRTMVPTINGKKV